MAGRIFYGRQEQRVVRDAFPPKLEFAYTLADSNGNVLASGEETLTDISFSFDIGLQSSSRMFYYEIKLLEDWAGERFAK
ncbi:MAG: DUF3016 domain-containing protein [Verrucomicrobia bacterium]|nr:DUF3016 domain-containing protein [Verrucomicrobiota bacterium]